MAEGDWKPIETAPFDRLIEVGVIGRNEVHPFAYPVRRAADGWLAVGIKGLQEIEPTHWRDWRRPD
jgi:hypothetical protein